MVLFLNLLVITSLIYVTANQKLNALFTVSDNMNSDVH